MGRNPCCEKMFVRKGPWSKEEDQILINYINAYGHANWRKVPWNAGLLRCGKSCRLRWMNYLRPDIKRGPFTREEEATIVKLHKTFGNRWASIAARLPGRTDNEIKNEWNTRLRKRLHEFDVPADENQVGDSQGASENDNNLGLVKNDSPPPPEDVDPVTNLPPDSSSTAVVVAVTAAAADAATNNISDGGGADELTENDFPAVPDDDDQLWAQEIDDGPGFELNDVDFNPLMDIDVGGDEDPGTQELMNDILTLTDGDFLDLMN